MQSKLLYTIENHMTDKVRSVCEEALKSKNYGYLRDVFAEFDERLSVTSSLHGITHTERVCFLGLLLANKLGLSDEDAKLLLTACTYHDIGRKNDGDDCEHGLRAANEVQKSVSYTGEDLLILKAAIEAHSISNRQMSDTITKYGIKDTDRALLIAKLLKDADALDRVRLSELDPSYLRFKESLSLIDFAEDLFWFYH